MVTAKEVKLTKEKFEARVSEWSKMSDLEKLQWNGLKGFLLNERVSRLFAPKIQRI